IKREIGTLKLMKHPNVVRLYEVSASKTKIYMVLEYVHGGELFDKIASKGRLPETEGRRLFQQLIDGVSYCHGKGVYHRDLKNDGLLHTTCGSPNYIAPEVLANKGYDGAASDVWSCGVILFVILTGFLPFDDRNLAVLYQKIFRGETQIPKFISPGAKRLIQRILDPNPKTRITIDEIKADEWFKDGYTPAVADDEDEDVQVNQEAFSIRKAAEMANGDNVPTLTNAFQLIGMSFYLDLSGFFEKEDVSERKIRFTSNYSSKELFEKIEKVVTGMGFHVQKKNGKVRIGEFPLRIRVISLLSLTVDCLTFHPVLLQLKVMQPFKGSGSPGYLSAAAEVFELSPSLYVVELRKSYGDSSLYRQLCSKLASDLGDCKSQKLLAAPATRILELSGYEGDVSVPAS
ncbi:hypothetical protein Taro_053931, partial [Colocasia esculenta]|nr:hypothetical protein [Colocasia esculenta]